MLCFLAVSVFVISSRNLRICTTIKRLNLKAPIFSHRCRLRRYLRLSTESSTFLTFIFKVKCSNQIHWQVSSDVRAAWNAVVFIDTTDDTNRHYVNGWQDSRRAIAFVQICQGVFAYSLILHGMSASLWTKRTLFETNPDFFLPTRTSLKRHHVTYFTKF